MIRNTGSRSRVQHPVTWTTPASHTFRKSLQAHWLNVYQKLPVESEHKHSRLAGRETQMQWSVVLLPKLIDHDQVYSVVWLIRELTEVVSNILHQLGQQVHGKVDSASL